MRPELDGANCLAFGRSCSSGQHFPSLFAFASASPKPASPRPNPTLHRSGQTRDDLDRRPNRHLTPTWDEIAVAPAKSLGTRGRFIAQHLRPCRTALNLRRAREFVGPVGKMPPTWNRIVPARGDLPAGFRIGLDRAKPPECCEARGLLNQMNRATDL